eukprot:30588-Pelagococcus_subviridis.AAC.6
MKYTASTSNSIGGASRKSRSNAAAAAAAAAAAGHWPTLMCGVKRFGAPGVFELWSCANGNAVSSRSCARTTSAHTGGSSGVPGCFASSEDAPPRPLIGRDDGCIQTVALCSLCSKNANASNAHANGVAPLSASAAIAAAAANFPSSPSSTTNGYRRFTCGGHRR